MFLSAYSANADSTESCKPEGAAWDLVHMAKISGNSTIKASGFASPHDVLNYFNEIGRKHNRGQYYFVKEAANSKLRVDFTGDIDGGYPPFGHVYNAAIARQVVCTASETQKYTISPNTPTSGQEDSIDDNGCTQSTNYIASYSVSEALSNGWISQDQANTAEPNDKVHEQIVKTNACFKGKKVKSEANSKKGNPCGGNDDGSGIIGGCPRWSVNPVSLNTYVYDTPVWYKTPYGPNIAFKLSYNSQADLTKSGPSGVGWNMPYRSFVTSSDEQATVTLADGAEYSFAKDGNNGFKKAYASRMQLEKTDAGYRLQQTNGSVYEYTHNNSDATYLTKITDVQGHSITMKYVGDRLDQIIDPQGRISGLRYDSAGRLYWIYTPSGLHAILEYDGSGNLIAITDMNGYRSTLSYDSNHYLTSITKPQGTWKFVIEPNEPNSTDTNNYPAPNTPMGEKYRVTITDPSGAKSEYFKDTSGSWYVSPENYVEYQNESVNNATMAKKTYYKYQSHPVDSKIIRIVYPDNTKKSFSYDSSGLLMSQNDENNHVTRYKYNAAKQLVSIRKKYHRTSIYYTKTTNNLPKTITVAGANGANLNTRYQYNHKNFLTKITYSSGADSRSISYQYNDKGQVTQIDGPRTDIDDRIMLSYYRDCSNVYSDARIKGEIDYCSQLRNMSSANEHITFSDYQAGGLVGKITHSGFDTNYRYDGLGRVISINEKTRLKDFGTTYYEYQNPQQGPTKITFADGTSITNTYDANDR
ncbi:MAG: RHS repeat protein, partial [Gammaproteobacteria bacterium]|nr:RHS repeat protein [Gammaproteobacteria bacterium]